VETGGEDGRGRGTEREGVGVVGHRAGRVLITTWRRYHDGSTRRVLGWARGCGEVRSRSSAFLTKILDE
jgi:hypothetical protein